MLDASDLDHLADLAGAEHLLEITGEEAEVLVSCASASIGVNAMDDGLALLRAALTIDPEHGRAWSLYGILLEKLDRPEQATAAYATALLHEDDDPFTALALARLHLKAGRIGKARSLLDWVMRRFPDAKRARQKAAALLERLDSAEADRL